MKKIKEHKKNPARDSGPGFCIVRQMGLPSLRARVRVVRLEAQFWWELRQTLRRSHFDATILTTVFIWWLEGAAIGRAGEGEQFIETVAEATEHAMGAIHSTVGPASLATVGVGFANNGFWNLHDTVEDIREGASELASSGVISARRCLNISGYHAGEGDQCNGKKREFFHAGRRVAVQPLSWQQQNEKM